MTLEELIQNTERSIDRSKNEIKSIVDAARSENRANLTEAETFRSNELFDTVDREKANLKQLRELKAAEDEADRKAQVTYPTGAVPPGRDGETRMSSSAALYGAPVASETPGWVDTSTGRPAALSRSQRFAEADAVREHAKRTAERDRIIQGTHGSLAQQVRALSTGSASGVVPNDWSSSVIDKARNAAVCLQAGVKTVPMPAKQYSIGRLTADGQPAFKAEGAAVTPSDQAFDTVTLNATSLSALTVVSVEFLQDAVNADSVLQDSIAKSMALEIDRRILFGGMVTADGPEGFNFTDPGPTGVLKYLKNNAAGNILGAGANGTAQTATSYYNELINLVYSVKRRNEKPNAIISSDALQQKYAMGYDTQGRPLEMPALLNNITWLTTNSIPSFTQGTGTSMTDVFCADWSQVLLGVRAELEIRVLNERYAEAGQVGILAFWRGDVAVARPSAVGAFRYLQAAA